MICDICGTEGVKIRRIIRTYGKGEDLLVIENIPLITCPHCGESYFTAETLHQIEKLKQSRSNIINKRLVKFASLADFSSEKVI
jgi:YgiT-type zinc finger domain-containing protein